MALPNMPELVVGSQLTGGSGYRIDYALVGYFSQFLYDYQDKYFFSASYRRDGSSRFAPETRWGNFWSVGASWRIDREDFMVSTSDWLSALTLKASYGAQGNDNLGTYYASKGLYTIVSNLGENALVSDRIATPKLKWETNLNFNVGVDFSLWNNRVSGSFDFFQRRSKDLLYSRPVAPSMGYSSVDENVGALKNTGIELTLNGTVIHTEDFMWKLGFNLTHYKNVVTELPLKDMPPVGVNKLKEGRSVYDFYTKEWAGVDPENGDPLWYMDILDKDENVIGRGTTNVYKDATDYYVNKSSLPKIYGGFNTAFSYKGIELSAIFAYSVGGYIMNRDITMILHNGSAEGRSWSKEILDRWTPDNRYTDVSALGTTSNNWTSYSTRFLQNNSYMRLKNLTLSYTLPKQLVNRASLSNVQVFVQSDNLFTIHRNQGLDPEQGITGLTYYRYPAMRTFSGGVKVTF
jgi:TonB-linked SusC/RagA family outer membrane protein